MSEKILTVQECHDLVVKTSAECIRVINEACRPLHRDQSWLICGRIISLIFSNHFQISLKAVTEEVVDENID